MVVAVPAWRRSTFTVPLAATEKSVEVAFPVEEETLKRSDEVSPKGPKMESFASGVPVPIATLPVLSTTKCVVVALAVDEAMMNAILPV